MATQLSLTSPGPDPSVLMEADAWISSIKAMAARRKQRRRKLSIVTFRCEEELHHDIQRLARKLEPEVSQSDLLNGIMRIGVDFLLTGRRDAGEIDLNNMDDEQRRALAASLSTLAQIGRGLTSR